MGFDGSVKSRWRSRDPERREERIFHKNKEYKHTGGSGTDIKLWRVCGFFIFLKIIPHQHISTRISNLYHQGPFVEKKFIHPDGGWSTKSMGSSGFLRWSTLTSGGQMGGGRGEDGPVISTCLCPISTQKNQGGHSKIYQGFCDNKYFPSEIWTNSWVWVPHPWISTCPLSKGKPRFKRTWKSNRWPTTQTLWCGGISIIKSFPTWPEWLDGTWQYLSLLSLLRGSSVVWNLYRLTWTGGFWTPPWLTWCGWNKYLRSSWKRWTKRTRTHHTHEHTTYSLTDHKMETS